MSSNSPSSAPSSVTVLIAAYNAAPTLARALDSVLAQTALPAQILVVDDGSTDATAELARTYADRGVTTLSQRNAGVSAARNHGLRHATGDLIAFLDADDWWAPAKLDRQLRALADAPTYAATYTGLVVVDQATGAERQQPPTNAGTLWPQLRFSNPFIPPSSVMLRRAALEAAGGFDETLAAGEDWDLWIKLHHTAGGFVTTPEPLTFYQLGSTGLSGDAQRMFDSFLQLLDGPLLRDLSGVQRALWRRRILSYQTYKAALTARGAGDRPRERAFMRQSLLSWPSPAWPPARLKSALVTFLRS